ncbi:MAG TPA: V-type ATPase subunit [Sphaerochaeta sp.]|nr:V-type ATPase subunit [Sphaerochaeta sp.]
MSSKDPVDVYGFIHAKLRARIGKMRQDRLVENLLKAPTLVDAVALLRDSPYRRVAEVYDRTGDLQQMELVLLYTEIEMHRLVTKYLEGRPTKLVDHLLAKIELDNLKNTIRLWYSSIVRRRAIRFRSEYLFKEQILTPIDWVALVNTTSWEEVQTLLSHTPYGEVISSFTMEMIEEEGLFSLESRLDRAWYVRLMETLDTLSARDREVARSIFLVEIDLRNLATLVRYGRYYQMDGSDIAALLLPWGTVASSKEGARYLAQSPTERDALALINHFYRGLEAIEVDKRRPGSHSDDPGVLENLKIEEYLAQRRTELYQKILGGDPFTIGLVLAYFFLFKEETATIKATINGKYYGYSEEYIRGVIG